MTINNKAREHRLRLAINGFIVELEDIELRLQTLLDEDPEWNRSLATTEAAAGLRATLTALYPFANDRLLARAFERLDKRIHRERYRRPKDRPDRRLRENRNPTPTPTDDMQW